MTRHRLTRAIALALALAMASGGWAASNLQIITAEMNDVETLLDDVLIQTDIHWADEDIPVRFLLFHPPGSDIYPFPANINMIPNYEIHRAIGNALSSWNDTEFGSDFEYEEYPLPSDFVGFANQINPAGFAQLDGYNFITFFDETFVGEALGVSNAFVVLFDFDLYDLPGFDPGNIIPIDLIGDNIGNQGANAVGIDLDDTQAARRSAIARRNLYLRHPSFLRLRSSTFFCDLLLRPSSRPSLRSSLSNSVGPA